MKTSESVNQYKKSDTFLALGVIALYFVAMAISGLFVKEISKTGMTVIGCVVNLIFTCIVFLVIKLRNQDFASIGLKGGNVKLSLILGGILSIILFFCNCLSNLIFEHQKFIDINEILLYIFYFFTVGLAEEVLFRGFLETRLHALTKNIWLDVILAGILFVFMHFPFRMVAYRRPFLDLLTDYRYMADLFITHLIFSYIRLKSDSLYGAILPHWISDLSYAIVTHI